MKLNIYIISHPIIQIFNNYITQSNYNTDKKYHSKIMMFLIYELFRKTILIQNIYINKLDTIKHFAIMNSMQKNYIFTNIVENFDMINGISTIFPNTEIQHYDINKINYIHKYNFNHITNIIIIEKFLDKYDIIRLLEDIINHTNIKEQQIIIACITCNHQIVERISEKYNHIKLYTTKIVNTLSR